MERGSGIVAAILAGTIGGVVGGLGAGWIRPREKAAPAIRAAVADEIQELRAEVTALREDVARLSQQRKAQSPGAPTPVTPAAHATGTAARDRALPDDPVFEAAVRDVVERMQQDRSDERDERRAEAARSWADRLAEAAKLSDAQKTKVLGIAQDMIQQMREQRDADAGAPRGTWGERRAAMREETDRRLGEVLTPAQMAIYRDSNDLRLDGVLRSRGRGGSRQ